jgi:hypothetical protein
MNLLEPTPAGIAAAAALVVAGAPLFGAGLRVVRLRRALRDLPERPLGEEPSGFVFVRGRVSLDSPLVGPLSGRPCAGFGLEVKSAVGVARIEERRPFRLTADGVVAQVVPARAAWDVGATAERSFAASEPLSQNLTALLDRSAEGAWIRKSGKPFTVVERALLASHECFIIGHAWGARPVELLEEIEVRRTGTDALPVASWPPSHPDPDLWIGADNHLDFLRISDRAPSPSDLAPAPLGLVLAAAGPLLSLTGLLYLARAAERFGPLSNR